jgi:DNA processing protein
LVVEANTHSGSIITAKCAAEQGREVFAIPGSIHSPMSKGCHELIKQGAKLVDCIKDITDELAPHLSH